ncbi:unnamed protein product [Staurois parvus]|uniref:Uncharacterized protein n=1 Tax=Staurois parvus TaxID=386267 RepID=A0ABN9DZH6_9NEOB|nr:unnamed protein product [Staurois parvus]
MNNLSQMVIAEHYRRGRELYVNNTVLSLVSSCTLLCMVLHSRTIQSSVLKVKHTNTAHCETAHS